MASDLDSLKSSGGMGATPKTFKPEDFSQEPVFEPTSSGEKPEEVPHTSGERKIYITLGIAGFVVLAGLVIYFFVWPLIFPTETTTSTNGGPVDETPTGTTTSEPIIHQSLFVTPAASVVPTNLNNLNMIEVNSGFNSAAIGMPLQAVSEVNLTVNNLTPDSSDLLATLFPQLNKIFLVDNFERDSTVYVYKDSNGSWPGYIFRLKSQIPPADVIAAMEAVELSNTLGDLFLTPVGEQDAAGFKDGLQTGGNTARYLSYGTPGASLNYGWFNNYFVVSTSFNGFKEALKLLGSS